MNSFILINGIALWLILALFIVAILFVILTGCGYTYILRENENLKRQNKYLKVKLGAAQDKLYKLTYKVPSLCEENKNV